MCVLLIQKLWGVTRDNVKKDGSYVLDERVFGQSHSLRRDSLQTNNEAHKQLDNRLAPQLTAPSADAKRASRAQSTHATPRTDRRTQTPSISKSTQPRSETILPGACRYTTATHRKIKYAYMKSDISATQRRSFLTNPRMPIPNPIPVPSQRKKKTNPTCTKTKR